MAVADTAIEWTDEVWNPVVGCSKVSPGCAHCYAETVHKQRLSGRHGYPIFAAWTPANAEHNVALMPHRLEIPLHWKKPRRVFVNSMSDLFHEQVPDDYIAAVFATMGAARRHTFQVLTKRPERMAELVPRLYDVPFNVGDLDTREALPNVWLGVSIENRRFVHRADLLRETPAAVRFISAEPLLGPLVIPRGSGGFFARDPRDGRYKVEWPDGSLGPELDLTGIDWLIVGGESGPKHRPMDPQWVRDLRDLVLRQQNNIGAGSDPTETAFFLKQWGGRTPKANGRELDGRTWDEFPEVEVAHA